MNTVTIHSTAEIKHGLCMSREGWVKAADHEASRSSWKRTPNAEGWWIAWGGKYPSLYFVSHLKHRDGLHVYLRSTWRHVATLGNEFECWQPVTVPSYFDGPNSKLSHEGDNQ